MKTILKISTIIALCLILVFSTVSCGGTSVSSTSGELGESITWEYDSKTNALNIKGSGKMTDFASTSAVPWASVKTAAKSITIEDGLENVGDYAFYGFSALESVTLPASVTAIGKSAFAFSGKLENISLPASLTTIGNNAFEQNTALEKIYYFGNEDIFGTTSFTKCESLNTIYVTSFYTGSIGNNVNIGAGTITANYNPITKTKSKTILENHVKTGSNSVLVAPVTVSEVTNIGAGSVISKDIKETWALAITRAPLKVISNWVKNVKH